MNKVILTGRLTKDLEVKPEHLELARDLAVFQEAVFHSNPFFQMHPK